MEIDTIPIIHNCQDITIDRDFEGPYLVHNSYFSSINMDKIYMKWVGWFRTLTSTNMLCCDVKKICLFLRNSDIVTH